MKQFLPGMGGGAPSPPPPPPPLPTRDDPAVAEAKEKQRMSELRRKGRRASILTSGSGVEDELGTAARPTAQAGPARSSQLLGQ
jgi:type IV secretory pathway VirB10-like protein